MYLLHTCTTLSYMVMWCRSKGWLDHKKSSWDGGKSNASWVGHLGIDEELSYEQFLMEHVTKNNSKC
jgi:hypothetical protein